MVTSLVPATAFAAGDVTAVKVIDALKKAEGFDGVIAAADAPELQLKITSADYVSRWRNTHNGRNSSS